MKMFNILVKYCRKRRSNDDKSLTEASSKPSMMRRSIYGSSKLLDLSSMYQGAGPYQLNSAGSLEFSAGGLSANSSYTDDLAFDKTLSTKKTQVAARKNETKYLREVLKSDVDLPRVVLPISRTNEVDGPVKFQITNSSGWNLPDVMFPNHQESRQQTYTDRRLSMRRLCIANSKNYTLSGAFEGTATDKSKPKTPTDYRRHNQSTRSPSLTQLRESTLVQKETNGSKSVDLSPLAELSPISGASQAAVRKLVRFAAHPTVGTTHHSTVYDRRVVPDANRSFCMLDIYRELMTFKLIEMKIHASFLRNNNLHLANITSEDRRKVCKILLSILAE